MLGRMRIVVVLMTCLTAFLMLGTPLASAHGNCQADGSIFWSTTGGPYIFAVTGQATYDCGSSQHYSSSGIVRLQWKNGNGVWVTQASSGDTQSCCSKTKYTITTPVANCLYNSSGPNYSWRVRIGYWHLWNADGKIAHSKYNTTVASTTTFKCKP
jgi:hypothetical protein